jgi:hypothetical protein
VVEPWDVWVKYLEPEYRVLGKHALWREDGKTNSYFKVNGEMCRDTMNANIPRHAIWRPGMTWGAIVMLTQANVEESLIARMLGGTPPNSLALS